MLNKNLNGIIKNYNSVGVTRSEYQSIGATKVINTKNLVNKSNKEIYNIEENNVERAGNGEIKIEYQREETSKGINTIINKNKNETHNSRVNNAGITGNGAIKIEYQK